MQRGVSVKLKRLSIRVLCYAQNLFLLAHGWRHAYGDWWSPPEGYPGRSGLHRGGHAVNGQKWANHDPVRRRA